jgi:hypothetical protein
METMGVKAFVDTLLTINIDDMKRFADKIRLISP